jgi:hypothetical protein
MKFTELGTVEKCTSAYEKIVIYFKNDIDSSEEDETIKPLSFVPSWISLFLE